MEIQIKCHVDESHLKTIRKWAKCTEKSAAREVYVFMNVTAVIEEGIATISMKIKREEDAPKAREKLLAMASRFGVKVV